LNQLQLPDKFPTKLEELTRQESRQLLASEVKDNKHQYLIQKKTNISKHRITIFSFQEEFLSDFEAETMIVQNIELPAFSFDFDNIKVMKH